MKITNNIYEKSLFTLSSQHVRNTFWYKCPLPLELLQYH